MAAAEIALVSEMKPAFAQGVQVQFVSAAEIGGRRMAVQTVLQAIEVVEELACAFTWSSGRQGGGSGWIGVDKESLQETVAAPGGDQPVRALGLDIDGGLVMFQPPPGL